LDIVLIIISGVFAIFKILIFLTFGVSEAGYQVGAFVRLKLLFTIRFWLSPVLETFFGFSSPGAIPFPITDLRAALSLILKSLFENIIDPNKNCCYYSNGNLLK